MLYTGRGDGGVTKTFGTNDPKVSKASELPEALGTLDELNAFIGLVCVRAAGEPRIHAVLREVQEKLFVVQAQVAGADKKLEDGDVKAVEAIIHEIEGEIPPIKSFIVAGGTELAALIDVARTMSRRAERRVVAVADLGLRELKPETKAYMNRLSSLLFALARLANHLAGVAEDNPKY